MPLSVEEMLELVLASVSELEGSETVALTQALGRVLAADILAPFPLPPFPRSAVDGYALKVDDCLGATPSAPVRFPLGEKVVAGFAPPPLGQKEAVFVTTGAMLPGGADAVILVERSKVVDATLIVEAPLTKGQHLSWPGDDIPAGLRLYGPGQRVGLSDVAILASFGFGEVEVKGKPRVAIFSTGDELLPAGVALGPAKVYDTNSVLLRSAVEAAGGSSTLVRILPDRMTELAAIPAACASGAYDLVITTGGTGASMLAMAGQPVDGLHDLIPGLLAGSGRILNQGVKVVPGKPTAFGLIAETPIFALAGWPYAVLITFHLFVAGAIAKMAGLPPPTLQIIGTFPLKGELRGEEGFRRYYPVRLQDSRAVPILPPPPPSAARSVSQLLEADGFICVESSLTMGDPVQVFRFR